MVKQNGLRFLTFNMYSPVFPTRSLKEFESINDALQIQFEPLFPRHNAQVRIKIRNEIL